MIIQSKGIKSTSSMGARLKYINKNDALMYTKNLFSYPDDIEGLDNEFIQNAKYLEGARGKNIAYSEMISLPATQNISREDQVENLKVLVDKHLELRGLQNNLAVIAIHLDNKNVHSHILVSSNSLFGTQRNRVTKAAFKQSQISLEEFRNNNFKNLPKTNHYSKQKLEKRIKNAEGKMRFLRKAITDKQKITSTFKHALTKTTKKEFQAYLKTKNLIVYKRGVKTIGLRDTSKKKNYRLETLEKGLRDKYLSYEKKLNINFTKRIKLAHIKPKPKKEQEMTQKPKIKKGGRDGRR